jgi:glycerol-3-phosphate dehydrogenase
LHARHRVLDSISKPPTSVGLEPSMLMRLIGRYGLDAHEMLSSARDQELTPIQSTPALWAELRWAARNEGVVHLDDLMLRRLRLGLQLPEGGLFQAERVRGIVQEELGWSDARWEQELQAYKRLWQRAFSPP